MGIFDHNPGNKPTPIPPPTAFSTYFNCEPTSGVTAILTVDDGSKYTGNGQQHITFNNIPNQLQGWGGNLHVECEGYIPQDIRVSVVAPNLIPSEVTLKPAFPAIPSRDDKGLAKLHFGGVWWNHSIYGRMPLFEACFMWLSKEDRTNLYTAKKAVGDRHLLVQVPAGVPLYDEPDQPYSADRFPALNYNGAALVTNLEEAIQEGFIPVVFMYELRSTSTQMIVQVINDLQSNKTDLVPYCILSPGWDGIFYSDGDWEPSHEVVPAWATLARSTYKGDPTQLMLFLEHNGHIPLGEGGGDYQPGGLMQGFDIIAGEYPPWLHYVNPPGDTVWQINKRMACPDGYIRPPDQPADDDPGSLPNYLPRGTSNPRGRFYYWVFETGVYEFVHSSVDDFFAPQRAYYAAMGCENIC